MYYLGPLVYTCVILISSCIKQDVYFKVVKKVYDVDKKLELLNRKPNLLRLQLAQRAYYISLWIGYIVYFIVLYSYDILLSQLKDRICSHICIIVITLMASSYIGGLLILNWRMKELNSSIEYLDRQDIQTVICNLTIIGNIHYMLSEISELLTNVFSFPLVLLCGRVYLVTTVMLMSYSGIVPQLQGEMTFWVALYWSLYTSIIVLCEMAYEEVSATK